MALADFLNWDLISVSSSCNGIPRVFARAPASAIFRFRFSFLNWSPRIIVPFFLRACLCVFIVRPSRATRMSALALCDSIWKSAMQSVLKLWPPWMRDW